MGFNSGFKGLNCHTPTSSRAISLVSVLEHH